MALWISRLDRSSPITPSRLTEIVDDVYPVLMKVRVKMQVAALDLHETTTGYRPDMRPIQYEKSWLRNIIERDLVKPWNGDVAAGLKPDRAATIDRMKSVVQGVAEEAARRTTLRAVAADHVEPSNDYVVGHARMIQGEYTCPWCIMLASRGPVYSSDEYDAWQRDHRAYMDQFHKRCDCVLVPVLKSEVKKWPGYQDYRRFEQAWARITKGYGGKRAVNAWRKHFREAAKRGVDPLTMPVLEPAQRQQAA